MRFKDKVCIVTGAAQGIGKATAKRLASEGATVIVADRVEPVASRVVQAIETEGGRARAVISDLETLEGANALVEHTLETFGRIDVAVHNVGGTIWAKPFSSYAPDEIEQEIQRSLWPTLWCCHAVLKPMIAQKSGVIVNVGSVATRGINRVPYSAAKGGVEAITTCLALENAEHNIRVNCISPGGVDVGEREIPRNPNPPSAEDERHWQEVIDQTIKDTPMARYGSPDELAAAIAFVASDEASYITGETIPVAGGYKP